MSRDIQKKLQKFTKAELIGIIMTAKGICDHYSIDRAINSAVQDKVQQIEQEAEMWADKTKSLAIERRRLLNGKSLTDLTADDAERANQLHDESVSAWKKAEKLWDEIDKWLL